MTSPLPSERELITPPPGISFEDWTRAEIARLWGKMPQWRKSVTVEGHPHKFGNLIFASQSAATVFAAPAAAAGAPSFRALTGVDIAHLGAESQTLSGDEAVALGTARFVIVSAESGTTDNWKGFTTGWGSTGDWFWAATTHKLTVKHNAGASGARSLITPDGQDIVVDGTQGGAAFMLFIKSTSWYLASVITPYRLVPITIQASAFQPTTTSGATDTGKVEISSGYDHYFMDFAQSVQSYAITTDPIRLPVGYDGGTITAIFHWTANSTSTNSVVWGCALKGLADGTALGSGTAFGTAQEVTDANGSSVYTYRISSATSAITPGGTAAAQNGMHVRIYRLGSGSDNLAATARLMSVTLVFTSNRLISG